MSRQPQDQAEKQNQQRGSAHQVEASSNSSQSFSPPPFNLTASANQSPIQMQRSGFWNGIGDALNLRSNEAELDQYEDYLDTIDEKRAFSSQSHTKLNHMPSTGRGKFDVHYTPSQNQLLIAIRYSLNFINGSATDYPDANENELQWTPEAQEHWERQMQRQIYSTWSGHFSFHCQKDYWEDLTANTSVVAYQDDSNPHFNFNITKVPRLDSDGDLTFRGSAVTPPSSADEASNASLDSNDIESYDKLETGRNLQTPIAHEAGHMLGLGDEYPVVSRSGTPRNHTAEDPNHMRSGYAHEHLVDEHFDAQVDVGRDSRIMSSGDQVQNEHGVTFLEALKVATNMEEWGYEAKLPLTPPRNPDQPEYNDGIVPSGDTRYA